MFQAYIIRCVVSGKCYVGITSASLRRRWNEHTYYARKRLGGALGAAIRKYGAESFTMETLCSAMTRADACACEALLIRQHGSLAPNGYNLTLGGEGRFGYRPSRESVELSAAKHRGRPCHPNTRAAAATFHRGRKRSLEHRARIAAAKRGVARSEATKAKLRGYWAGRRSRGEFKTSIPYEHARGK